MKLELKHKVIIAAGVIGGLTLLYYLAKQDSESMETPRMTELDMKLHRELKNYGPLKYRADG